MEAVVAHARHTSLRASRRRPTARAASDAFADAGRQSHPSRQLTRESTSSNGNSGSSWRASRNWKAARSPKPSHGADAEIACPRRSAAPKATRHPTTSQTGPISGYMDFHLNRPEHEDPILDFHRFVLLFNHSFSDRLRFIGELEVEHALVEGLEESGELELEQAYLDFRVNPAFNLRAGMLLAPVGIINERHEPPSYLRRRAAVRRHVHHPDDVVRRRRRHSRRVRRGLAISRLSHGAARRHAESPPKRGSPRRARRGSCRTSATSRRPRGSNTAGSPG